MVKVCRRAHFSAAHRLFNKDWSDEKNKKVYGKCSNPNFHGHNYELIVAVEGNINKETGYLLDLKVLKSLITNEVEQPFDHKNLNIDVPDFKYIIPTTENIAIIIWNRLKKKLPKELNLEVTLHETRNNFVIYKGE